MGGLASSLSSGFSQLFKRWGKGISNAVDNYLLDKEARKAISDEVRSKFKPIIDRAQRGESRKAANIKDLDQKLTQSKADLKAAQDKWQQDYDSALAGAKAQRQKDISDYDTQLKTYQGAADSAKQGRRSILDQLAQQEATYTPTKTRYIDVNTGDVYLLHPATGEYKNITQIFKNASKDQQRAILGYMKDFDERLIDTSSGTPKVINAFDEATSNFYKSKNNNIFDSYVDRVGAPKRIDLRDADNQITKASDDLTAWQAKGQPKAWGKRDSTQFEKDFNSSNAQPTDYTFNGQKYSSESDLKNAYQEALDREQAGKDLYSNRASRFITSRNEEIAKRIQDAKDIKKAKLTLGAGAGAGALYAGAAAMYGGDDTGTGDNTDITNNIDNTADTYTGESELKDGQQIDTGSDPDKAEAEAVLAGAAYDKGVEDGNSVRSSDDLGNNIAASTGGHTIDDELYELLKNMKDRYKADAIANYIYSRHGDDPEVQNLGWRGWLNKYYGDSLRSIMNIDPSGYKGMHVSGGL